MINLESIKVTTNPIAAKHLPTLLLLTIAGLLFSSQARAIDYDVEIIIFEHVRDTSVGSSSSFLVPVIRNAEKIPQAQVPGAAIQPLSELRLTAEAEKIKTSNNHRLMYHGGWRQAAIDEENAPYMSIAFGRGNRVLAERGDADSLYLRGYLDPPSNLQGDLREIGLAKLHGGIKVWVGRFLHFETLLSYTPPNANYSFAFESERRMRSRQLHYIDHPRVGIITKIFPVDESAPN